MYSSVQFSSILIDLLLIAGVQFLIQRILLVVRGDIRRVAGWLCWIDKADFDAE